MYRKTKFFHSAELAHCLQFKIEQGSAAPNVNQTDTVSVRPLVRSAARRAWVGRKAPRWLSSRRGAILFEAISVSSLVLIMMSSAYEGAQSRC